MVARWLLGFTLGVQVTFAIASDLPANPRDDTPAQSLKRLQKHFSNQASYDLNNKRAASEMVARVQMGAPNSAERARVEQLLTRSGVALDGSRATISTKVTQSANSGKVASTLVERLKNAKDYAKHAGKASIPAFVGGAAVQALVDGVGWVMDDGGKVQKKVDLDELADYNKKNLKTYWSYIHDKPAYWASTQQDACDIARALEPKVTIDCRAIYQFNNKNYSPDGSTKPQGGEASPVELEAALKKALDSNNPALAAAIAEAIKAAYSYDATEGQKPTSNVMIGEAQEDMTKVRDKAFDNPTPTSTRDKPEGYYKITDGDKTIEGNVYETDPKGTITPQPDTGTGTGTGTGGSTFQLPAFCDWAAVVCDFIDWVKEDEQIEEDEPEKIDDSIFDRKFDIKFEMAASCPPNPTWNFKFIDQQWSKEINITSICDFFRYLGYAIVFASNMTALWIVYAAVTVREQG